MRLYRRKTMQQANRNFATIKYYFSKCFACQNPECVLNKCDAYDDFVTGLRIYEFVRYFEQVVFTCTSSTHFSACIFVRISAGVSPRDKESFQRKLNYSATWMFAFRETCILNAAEIYRHPVASTRPRVRMYTDSSIYTLALMTIRFHKSGQRNIAWSQIKRNSEITIHRSRNTKHTSARAHVCANFTLPPWTTTSRKPALFLCLRRFNQSYFRKLWPKPIRRKENRRRQFCASGQKSDDKIHCTRTSDVARKRIFGAGIY